MCHFKRWSGINNCRESFSKCGSKGRKRKGKMYTFDSTYVTEHMQMTKYTLTNDLSGNRFAVSYCSCKNLFKSVGNTSPIEKLVKHVTKQFTNK